MKSGLAVAAAAAGPLALLGGIAAESSFLRWNFRAFYSGRRWHLLPSALNAALAADVVVILAASHPLPESYVGNPTSPPGNASEVAESWWRGSGAESHVEGLWSIDIDVEVDVPRCRRLQDSGLPMGIPRGKQTWYLDDPRDRLPTLSFRALLAAGLVLRWMAVVLHCGAAVWLRLGALGVRRCAGTVPPMWVVYIVTTRNLLAAAAIGISLVIFAVGIVAIEASDCIEWWALGSDALQMLGWQVTFWLTNYAAAGSILAALGAAKAVPRLLNLPPPPLCSPTVLLLLVVYFALTAFLVSFVAVVVGVPQPWIAAMWVSGLVSMVGTRVWSCRFGPAEEDFVRELERRGMSPEERNREENSNRHAAALCLSRLAAEAPCFALWQGGGQEKRVFTRLSDTKAEVWRSDEAVPSPVGAYSLTGPAACLICLDRGASCVFEPCLHFAVCGECFLGVLSHERRRCVEAALQAAEARGLAALPDLAGMGSVLCPLCRGRVEVAYSTGDGSPLEDPAGPPLRPTHPVGQQALPLETVLPHETAPLLE
eukprot:Polyplicarium_translucidae@DN2192_c0_g1_i1.p1